MVAPAAPAVARTARVLRVGTYHGIRGRFHSIQKAVNAARPGDWILVGPGDYHEQGVHGASEPAGVLIRTPRLHVRGMNRNSVIVDGTKRGSPSCSRGARNQKKTKDGRNGIEVFKASGVYIENLTVCNYLTGASGDEGNEIWWNGGDGSGKIGMGPWWGNYITATSTYSNGVNPPFADYGIFVSNSRGPGKVNHSYASGMGDAGYYVGACPDCHAVITHAHAQHNALGFSGTNAGGHLVIKRSEFDHNKTGPTSDSENNDDAPSPQNGLCPHGAPGSLGNGICDIWKFNYIHNNNNPNVPGNSTNGLAGAVPVGSGAILGGTEYIALWHNRIVHNNAWGVWITDSPYMGNPPPGINQHCQGGTYVNPPPSPNPTCYFQAYGNRVIQNHFANNGRYGNPSNGDIAMLTTPHSPGNCFRGNVDKGGLTSDPPDIQSPPYNPCGQPNGGVDPVLLGNALCGTQLLFPCPANTPGAGYPHAGKVVLHMPPRQPTMPNPCRGVPSNAWCRHGRPRRR
jgi:hypothetical protein